MIEVKKFKLEHLDKFDPSNIIADFRLSMLENHMNPKVDIVSLVNDEGQVVCFAGVNHLRTGVGEVWVIRSELINSHKFEFYKAMRGLIDFLIVNMELHRVELAIDCRWKGGDKWARSIGFSFESVKKAYDFNYNDHAIYTRITRK